MGAMRKSTLLAVTLTVLWLGFFGILLWWTRGETASLALNEWGDFFAGMVAPVAFFWLVFGYFQQATELELNTEALVTQQKELALQVEATKSLALEASRQAASSEAMLRFEEDKVARALKPKIAIVRMA